MQCYLWETYAKRISDDRVNLPHEAQIFCGGNSGRSERRSVPVVEVLCGIGEDPEIKECKFREEDDESPTWIQVEEELMNIELYPGREGSQPELELGWSRR